MLQLGGSMLVCSFTTASNLLQLIINRALASVVSVVLYNRAHLHQVVTYTVCTHIDVTMLLTVSDPTVTSPHAIAVPAGAPPHLQVVPLKLAVFAGCNTCHQVESAHHCLAG